MRLVPSALAALCLLLPRCANLTGGAGGETTNGIVQGRLVTETGLPAADAVVLLVPVYYNPATEPAIGGAQSCTTDADGAFTLSAALPGVYNVQAENASDRTGVLVAGVTVNPNDTARLGQGTLRAPGSLRVEVSDQADTVHSYVYLPGTTRWAMVRNTAAFIDAVPAGFIPAVYYANSVDSSRNHVIKTNLTVRSGITLAIGDFDSWPHSKRLILNTTAGGAGVAGSVFNFPAAIRLSAANFDFSQAGANGADIRFTKADGTPLPHEIEAWNPAGGAAALWVKVDTIYGNNASQYITMLWGNPNARDVSNSRAVFDTGNGFQGVWHLGGAGNAMAKDATANQYDGTPVGMSAASAVTGVVGGCRQFSGDSCYLRMTNTASSSLNMAQNGTYTVSAWVNTDTVDYAWHLVVSKGHRQYYLKQRPIHYERQWEFVVYHDKELWNITHDIAAEVAGKWTYITGVRSGTRQYFYANGALVNNNTPETNVGDGTVPQPNRDESHDVTIGRYLELVNYPVDEGFCQFNGRIDEAGISSAARSSDWIRLCYMNQRPDGDRLVQFKK
jgi:hypothetical protein